MRDAVAVLVGEQEAQHVPVSQKGHSNEIESQLAVAQEMIRKLELVRLDQDYRIKELESQLKGDLSTATSVHSSQLEEPTVSADDTGDEAEAPEEPWPTAPRTPRTHSPFQRLLASEARTPEDAGDKAELSHEELHDASDSEVETLSFEASDDERDELSIPSTPELPERCPVYTCASERMPAGPMLPPGMHLQPLSSFYQVPVVHEPVHEPLLEVHWYRVSFLGGVEVRYEPSVDGPRAGLLLPQNSIFPVSELLASEDGRTYLRLADGAGWLFDDAAHHPEDPSVVRLTNPELAAPTATPIRPPALADRCCGMMFATTPLPTPTATPTGALTLATAPLATTPKAAEAASSSLKLPKLSQQGTEWAEMEDDDDESDDESDDDSDASPDTEGATVTEDATRSWLLDERAAKQLKRGKRGGAKRRKRGGVKHRPRAERDAVAGDER